MINKFEMRFAGAGGQGIILAGIILAEAVLLDGKNCVETQSYGPEARGGASKSEVIISNDIIDYPKVQKPDILAVLSQKAYNMYKNDLKNDGIIVTDSSINVDDNAMNKVFSLPIIETAKNKVGSLFTANIVLLGVVAELTNIVSQESLMKAIIQKVPKDTEKLNKIALEAGYNLVRNVLLSV
ncbi:MULTISPECIES: 2-oxoacid:acceptor oxidoreductase family protein [Thermoanaerobacterium]|uniref:Pyruvate/ketoisovalerate oxidoreductase n=1 Tax=Thermoanaerobacterium saccharolyticum (strain DSM 8691 / JW/SL-YS485) TaxID=1094508 RepID=I3VXB9_THESW|nr:MULTISPECIES: 2-oxoacid:acceptor oxidoreductase family protein [Thermoanaerobacterium]AFK87164.1 Pyruvate/ketoisovalerate oxidoreductase [Thermoanaerobacterium saccharolyticum JW/SL-YS485]